MYEDVDSKVLEAEKENDPIKALISPQIFRIVKSGKMQTSRLHYRAGDGRVPFKSFYEHCLIFPAGNLIAIGMKPADFPAVQPLKQRVNAIIHVDFPGIAFQTLTDIQTGKNAYLTRSGALTYFAMKEPNNNTIDLYVTFKARNAYGRITFARFDEDMLPTHSEWFHSPGLEPLKGKVFSVEACKEWKFVLETSADWRLHEKYGYLPSRVFCRRDNSLTGIVEAEYRFLDWRLGDDVDTKLLEKESFNREGVLKTIDFDDWVNKFEKWKR